MPGVDVDAALGRHRELLDSRLPPRERRMANGLCPEDGAKLTVGCLLKDWARDRDSNGRVSETVIVRCPRCRFWMRVFEYEWHRPWMHRVWDIRRERMYYP